MSGRAAIGASLGDANTIEPVLIRDFVPSIAAGFYAIIQLSALMLITVVATRPATPSTED